MSNAVTQTEVEELARSALGPAMMKYEDVADYLGIGLRTCKRWVAKGTLPAPDLNLNGIVRWRPATIDKWVAKQAPCNDESGTSRR